jgi:hypothetical protein
MYIFIERCTNFFLATFVNLNRFIYLISFYFLISKFFLLFFPFYFRPSARAFIDRHPTGEEIEVYIISSTNGCYEIRQRAQHLPYLKHRIDTILIDLSPGNDPDDIDLTQLPALLYNKYNMKLVNNDGGHQLMKKCYEANIMSQFNITLCRNISLKEVVSNYLNNNQNVILSSYDTMTASDIYSNNRFNESVDIFFQTQSQSSVSTSFMTANDTSSSAISTAATAITTITNPGTDYIDEKGRLLAVDSSSTASTAGTGNVRGTWTIPVNFVPCQIIVDRGENVAVFTFDTHNVTQF